MADGSPLIKWNRRKSKTSEGVICSEKCCCIVCADGIVRLRVSIKKD